MTQWLAFGVMTAIAIFIVLWPLWRRRSALASGGEIAVYKDQLEELARDRLAGLIGAAEAQAARVEVSRRLFAAADMTAAEDAAGDPAGGVRRRRIAVVTVLTMLPLGAMGLYGWLGSPALPSQPAAARLDAPVKNRSIETLVGQVEAHLDRNPEDGRGWQLLAPVYMRLGRFLDATRALRNAVRLLGESAERQADLGEALVDAADGVVTTEAAAAFERALALDAHNVKARFFIGLSAEQDGKPDRAAAVWRNLLREAPSGAGWVGFVRDSLARVDTTEVDSKIAPPVSPGPRPEDVAAAAQLRPEERSDMIRAMVGRLAERLQEDGADVDGWLRLVRSYVVLGHPEQAQSAVSAARRALAGDAEKVRRLDELVRELGLGG
jgi:cytochrome c-type biogenesis protein CcmH